MKHATMTVTTLLLATSAWVSGCGRDRPPPPPCVPACPADWTCSDGTCLPPPCGLSCPAHQHCGSDGCTDNVCLPSCGEGERCLADGADACACGEGERCPSGHRCVGGNCRGPCEDFRDNDEDGWIDGLDPDCLDGASEIGFGATSCNDGSDDDGDGLTDGADPDCITPENDEVIGIGSCNDECNWLDARSDPDAACHLYDAITRRWLSLDAASDTMHHRARRYAWYLRRYMLPAGGVANADFASTDYDTVVGYDGTGDSAIWTGTYLAAEALRALATGAPDALAAVSRTVRTLHTWFTISGDPGYLARYAIRDDGDPRALAAFDLAGREVHRVDGPDGHSWYWRGHISRDQYQGVLLGYSLAYQALAGHDEEARALIREDVVTLVEQLMLVRDVTAAITVDGITGPLPIQLTYTVLTDDETDGHDIEIVIDTANFESASLWGFQEFMPNVAVLLRQILGDGLVPDIPRAGSAIMLASFFNVALQVTDSVTDYAPRRQAIESFYLAHVEDWLDIAAQWQVLNECGASYYGIHIAFEPMYNLARLELDPDRMLRVRDEVLRDRMWSTVQTHKNVLFAFIQAASSLHSSEVPGMVADHLDQLALFPSPPRAHTARDLSALYPADGACPGLSTEATDVNHRIPEDYLWQRNPWKLSTYDWPTRVYPGVDYLIAYWLGRYHGFVPDDSPHQCLRWHHQ